jgi:hypothetical protein
MIRATQVAQLLPAGKGPPSEQLSLPGRGGPAAGLLGSRAAHEIWVVNNLLCFSEDFKLIILISMQFFELSFRRDFCDDLFVEAF